MARPNRTKAMISNPIQDSTAEAGASMSKIEGSGTAAEEQLRSELARGPDGMRGEQAVGEANLIGHEDSKYQADQASREAKMLSDTGKTLLSKREGGSHRKGDQDHAEHGADTKDDEIS